MFAQCAQWYAGQLLEQSTITLDATDPGLMFGATTFSTLRVYDRRLDAPLTQWAAHCDRLRQTREQLGLPQPDWVAVETGARLLADRYPVLRVTLFADGREWVMGRQLPDQLDRKQAQGIVAWLAREPQYRRAIATHKTGNYFPCWLALRAAQTQAIDLGTGPEAATEAILIDQNDRWLETSTGNLWGLRDGVWYTPPLGDCLPGIARSHLIRQLQRAGRPVVVDRPWTADWVDQLEAIAYSNSAVEVVPIHTLLDRGDHRRFEIAPVVDLQSLYHA
ncbi:MAG: 4-amino-4-deoxychorismate lyase [Oscillatoriales cyanobacterium]|nr:MAG: 4-amino-4-deoxychorismate lyase [Oscillatoriales cyanobacterium]